MSAKDDFLKWASEHGIEKDTWKENLKDFVKVLNSDPDVKRLFRAAVEEAKAEADNPAAGLAGLFGPMAR